MFEIVVAAAICLVIIGAWFLLPIAVIARMARAEHPFRAPAKQGSAAV